MIYHNVWKIHFQSWRSHRSLKLPLVLRWPPVLFWRIGSAVVEIPFASVVDVTWFSRHVCQKCSCRNDSHNPSSRISVDVHRVIMRWYDTEIILGYVLMMTYTFCTCFWLVIYNYWRFFIGFRDLATTIRIAIEWGLRSESLRSPPASYFSTIPAPFHRQFRVIRANSIIPLK